MRSKLIATRQMLTIALLCSSLGCASLSNPTTYPSIPVRRLPEEVLGPSRDSQLDIPQTLLRQPPNQEHRVDAGDTLGVYLVEPGETRPILPGVLFPTPGALIQNIGIGTPVQVLEDGTISVPLLEPIDVRKMTIREVQDKLIEEYVKKGLFRDKARLTVSLFRPRQIHVLVVRQDFSGVAVGTGGALSGKRGSGVVLDLPIYKNDVLTALTNSGGLPGNEARNELLIQRAKKAFTAETMAPEGLLPGIETIRIPLRLRPGEPIPFRQNDVILEDGDIIFVQSRDAETYFTGGLMQAAERPLPRDYDLDVVRALILAGAPIANGGQNFNTFQGNIASQGLGSPSPSQLTVLRRCPGNRQIAIRIDLNRALNDPRERINVHPGDILILQETIGEAFTRYATSSIRNTFSGMILKSRNPTDTISISSP